ncbi:MAG: hypothetical protein AAGC80_29500 [Rhodococcus sp. (in: high G+C Gram-positive bacteria)]
MRLLLTSEVHRPVDSGVEIAASPDSHRPEPWLWDLEIRRQSRFTSSARTGSDVTVRVLEGPLLGSGANRHLRLRHHRRDIAAQVDTIDTTGTIRLDRPQHEIWILVGVTGVVFEGRRRIGPADALILEGEDPSHIELVSADLANIRIARFRLRRSDGADLRWVP